MTQDSDNMKLFKIFKKKSPTSASNGQASNLVCNIHWAEVQRELGHDVIKENRNIVNYNTNHVPAYKSSGWNSCDEENYSSGGNSWSSVSLSSSNKTTSAEQFQEENFSRCFLVFFLHLTFLLQKFSKLDFYANITSFT